MRFRGSITYDDGTTVEYETGKAARAEWELYAHRHGFPMGTDAPPTLSLLVVAHYAIAASESFEEWRLRVDDYELGVYDDNGKPIDPAKLAELAAAGVPPTPPAPNAG